MHSALLRATKKELTAPFVTLLVIRFNPYVVQGEGVCMLEPHLYVSSSFKLHFQESDQAGSSISRKYVV